MADESATRVMIIGAGLGGSLMACHLARAGYDVALYEHRPDPREQGFLGGRSINLALSTRGILGLDGVGLADQVLADAIPMRGRMMHSAAGELTFQPYSKNPDDAINSVSRGGLNLALINAAAAYQNVSMHFSQRCIDVDLDAPAATFYDESTKQANKAPARVIIGADGAFSAVRHRLQKLDRFDFSQHYLEHGYKELTIPPAADGEFAMEPHALHIWPRRRYMMIALPNRDRSFTCTLFWPFHGDNSFDTIAGESDVIPYFEDHFPDAVPLIPTLAEDYMTNPVSSLVTVRCNPWHYEDKLVLLGDAAHAVVPFYGQGMNAAFEDCTVLAECINGLGPDWGRVFRTYSGLRKENGDAIADLALNNFIEMRDRVGSPAFLFQKRMEKLLHRIFPMWFTPLYNMVSFSHIPYAEAKRRADRQSRILRRVGWVILIVIMLLVVGILW